MSKVPSELIEAILTGKAVLFTGAGFSCECKNVESKTILDAKTLSYEICKLGNFAESDDLMYSAERYIANNNKSELVIFLKNNYTAKQVVPYVEKITSFKWKDIYTTNYDNTIELAGKNIGKKISAIDMEFPLDSVSKEKNKCIHINGFIETLSEDNINKTFKLSYSSYCNADGFLNSPWYTMFKRSIERCSALIFIGYSLYDLDIRRILTSIDGLNERTHFIVSPNSTDKDLFTLKQFGQVYACGVESFSAQLPDPKLIDEPAISLSALTSYTQTTNDHELNDADIDNLLLYGDYRQAFIENSVFSAKSSEYIVLREQIDVIERELSSSNIVITSELGNGKTIFLQQMMAYLSRNNTIYFVSDYFSDIISDLEALSKLGEKCIIVIDDYNKVIEIFDCYPLYNQCKIKFLISARSSAHEKYRDKLSALNFTYNEIAMDIFSDNEAAHLLNLLDSVGLWGSINSRGFEKERFFSVKCNSQISSLLVAMLNSPDIKKRIKNVFDGLFKNKSDVDIKKIAMTSAFLCIQNIKTDAALISEIAGNGIYNSILRSNEAFLELFKFEHNKIKAKSTIFCQTFIKNYFEPEYTMNFLLEIAESFKDKRTQSHEYKEIFRSALKFSFVEQLLPDENKKLSLEKYYERLKKKVSGLIQDPHFWVQYAMAKIATNDFMKAQQFLDNAYGKAKVRYNYDTYSIDTQQARLYLLDAIKNEFVVGSHDLFRKAHKLLRKTPNDIYKFRQLYLYVDYYESVFQFLDDEKQKNFIHSCKEILHNIKKDLPQGGPQYLKELESIENIVSSNEQI